MKADFLIELSDELQETIAGGSLSDISAEILNDFNNVKQALVKSVGDKLSSALTKVLDDIHKLAEI